MKNIENYFSFVDNMNPVVVLFLLFFSIFVFVGSYVFSKNERNGQNVIMLLVCLGFSFTCLGDAFMTWTLKESDVHSFHAFSSIGFVTFWPLILNLFVLFRSNIKVFKISFSFFKRKMRFNITPWYLFIGISYVVSIFYVYITLKGVTASVGYVREGYAWIDEPTKSFWYNPIYTSIVFPAWVICTFYNIGKIIQEAKKDENLIRKRQFKIIAWWGFPLFFLGVTFNVYSPMFGVKLPAIGHLATGFWILAVAYAITKYKLFISVDDFAGRFLLENASEIVVITDMKGRLIYGNKRFYESFDLSKNNVLNSNISFNKLTGSNYFVGTGSSVSFSKEREIDIFLLKEKKYFNLTSEIMSHKGFNVGVGIIFSDITLLKNQNEILDERVKEKTKESEEAKNEAVRRLGFTEKYTSRSVVDIIANGGDPTIIPPENKIMAILFADIRGFAGISEKMTPRNVFGMLNFYFSRMNICIVKNGGEIDKIIGDGIMARFPNSTFAVKAAIDIRKNLPNANDEIKSRYGEKLNNGIGINYGEVIWGNLGSDEKLDLTVTGDIVNAASRIEELTKHYHLPILISEEVKNSLDNDVKNVRFIDEVLIVGKKNPAKIFEVFDHERQDIILMKQGNQPLLEEAFELYRIGQFEDALKIYVDLERKMDRHTSYPDLSADPVVDFYIERCKEFARLDMSGDLNHWTGVYSFLTK